MKQYRWKERCRIFALLNPFSVCDETKNYLNMFKPNNTTTL